MILKQKKSFSLAFILFVGVLFIPLLIPIVSHAETHVYSGDIRMNWTWDKAGSPYILEEPIYIPKGYSLYIKEGVDIMPASTTDSNDPYSLTFDGDLTVSGTKEDTVNFFDLYSLYFSNSNSSIRNATFHGTGLDFNRSTSTIELTIITDSFNAITAKGSHLDISKSILNNNSYGIASYMYHTGPFMMFIHKAMADMINDPLQNIINIHDSTISGNINFGIINQTTNTIEAIDNWWGSKDGPLNDPTNLILANGEKIAGPINVNPWKDKDPNASKTCCSNVLFIPGIEASRLYKDETGILGTSTNMLWEPNRNDDIGKLSMNSQGISIDPAIYTKDIIDSALGIKNIYKSFISSMDSLVSDNSINKWLALPYDWRKGVYDIVDDDLIAKVNDLASTSITGKIIIIAHSNGGLIVKALLKKLEEQGKANIVENTILIAVPELGTPQALLSMLHGYSQSIAGGLILTENIARNFSQNLPGAYGLLPSQKFFEKNPIAVISDMFSGNSIKLLSTYYEMKNFLFNNSFSKASSTDINIPLNLNSYLFSLADSFHQNIDIWKPASTTKILSIFGWGMPTAQGITYENDIHCNKKIDKICDIAYLPNNTIDGDGTVITKANSGNSDSTLFFNLKNLNAGMFKQEINHANILESVDLLAKVKDTIIKSNISNPDSISTSSVKSYDKYFSSTEPIDTDKYLTIKIYSPVDIHIYDKNGNHTGLIENPIVGKDLEPFEKNIPGSYYGNFGRIKMIQVPYNQDYQIVLKGNDAGVFSADAQITQFDKVIASTSFSEMPATPLMNVDFIIASSTDSFATSSIMNMDVDGDGITDFVNHSDIFLHASTTNMIADMSTYIESMKKIIIALKLPVKIENTWLKRIDKITKILDKKHSRKAEKIVKKLSNKRFKNKTLTEVQKSAILATFEKLLESIEEHN